MDKQKMPKPGEIYNHFKDKPYQIITVATNTETGELMVVYQALYGDFKTYVRPLEMFMSEVDRQKYPEARQKYRFELRTVEDGEPMVTWAVHKSVDEAEISNTKAARQIPDTKETSGQAETLPVREYPADRTSNEAVGMNSDGVNTLLLRFLDAESYNKKLELITSNIKHLNDRLINDMAVALDCSVDEGPLDQRIQGLIYCLQAMCRFEDRRLR